ncbi:hypothetical protein AGR7A_Lc60018 [Agrobacterium deltaense NCPPB 1641]|uniref:Uncharacterized protein n=1 Tax=Agrobacterium deltaense NCPPB 1641 TaxID=1183425 RepID=A0A1S7U6F4_9HYPH|nr:hypothetical protein AGR7A_Lc60018 [Agrobacterium deltaense NCPPB 1641]
MMKRWSRAICKDLWDKVPLRRELKSFRNPYGRPFDTLAECLIGSCPLFAGGGRQLRVVSPFLPALYGLGSPSRFPGALASLCDLTCYK